MLKRNLVYATFGGMMLAATSAFAATPAMPIPISTTSAAPASTTVTNPAIEQVSYWWRGRSYPYRWRGSYYGHRRWFGNGWRYW